jgi:hypothetical protein
MDSLEVFANSLAKHNSSYYQPLLLFGPSCDILGVLDA